jgi:hypothetical protein
MQYRAIGTIGEFDELKISPTALTFTSIGGSKFIYISGNPTNSFSISNPINSWVNTEAPVPPAPTGIAHRINVAVNTGGTRSGFINYIPTNGTMKSVYISQNAYIPQNKTVRIVCSPGGYGTNSIDEEILCGALGSNVVGSISPNMIQGECFYPTFKWCICKPSTSSPYQQYIELKCNGIRIYCKTVNSKLACNCSGTSNIGVCYGDCIELITYASAESTQTRPSKASIEITSIGSGIGSFNIGTPKYICSVTCRAISGSGSIPAPV